MKEIQERIEFLEWYFSDTQTDEPPRACPSSQLLLKKADEFLAVQAVQMFFHKKLHESGLYVATTVPPRGPIQMP